MSPREFASADQKQRNAMPLASQSLTDASTINWNWNDAPEFRLTFTAGIGDTRAMANPTGTPMNGRMVMFVFKQDAVGGRSINSWGSMFNFPDGNPSFSSGANKR